MAAKARLTDGRDAVAVERRLDVRYGKKDRAADTTEADDAGGLPCTEGATADPNAGGGFVFNTVHNILPDVPPANIVAMYEAVAEFC